VKDRTFFYASKILLYRILKDGLILAMERLADLPPKDDAEMTPQESEVMQKYFNAPQSEGGSSKGKAGWMDTIKLALYGAVLFLVLANPWIDSVMCMVPYCGDSALMLLAIKAVMFVVLFVIVNKFLVN
jgi:hypothetical protein